MAPVAASHKEHENKLYWNLYGSIPPIKPPRFSESPRRKVLGRLGDAVLQEQCGLLGRADLNMAFKSLFEELSRNITTLQEHDAVLESRQDQLQSDFITHETIAKENENIIKQIIDDIKSKHEEATHILEKRMNNLKIQLDSMLERFNSQQSCIPRYMKANMMHQIKTWIEDETKHVKIDATIDALDLLHKFSSLTVAGNSGCGKTAFIRHLALQFMSQGYEIVPVIEPKTILEYHDETKKQVFVLDDACGVHTVNRQKRTAWLDYSQVIQDCLSQSGSLLLVSVRLSILNSGLLGDLKVLSQNVINLKDKKYALSYKNRKDIFQSYFKRGHDELGISDKSLLMHDSFPLLCRFSSSSCQVVTDDKTATLVTKTENEINDLDTFFQTPIRVIETEIKSLRSDSPYSYCVLVLCLLFNGKLPKHDLFYSIDLLLQNGASPNKISLPSNNFPGSTSTFPVVHAAMYGRFNIVKRLLRNGATIESTGPYSCTLLIFASSYGHYDLVKYLLDRHVDINATNMFQNTALLYASKKGHTNIVNLLLENGALTNTVCNKSSTPLIEAASKGTP
ncbi:unnamed protein product [Mytilus edulis]|uniref:Novel STAND NTPase 3 domain-containing protein n=1 Tax=Mytilus edulis TaxID=6550 RepID=A0A8S3SLT1_MYTED|nr:unnamed protein product [Mytilus edulis]